MPSEAGRHVGNGGGGGVVEAALETDGAECGVAVRDADTEPNVVTEPRQASQSEGCERAQTLGHSWSALPRASASILDEYRRNKPDIPTRASALRRLAMM